MRNIFQIPFQREIDRLRILELGLMERHNWDDHPDNVPDDQNPMEHDKYAGVWTRAVFLGQTSKDSLKTLHTSYGFNAYLIDFGREIAVHRYYARRAVWQFLPYPVIAPKFMLMIHGKFSSRLL